jgi:hypothetical protein
VDLAVAQHGGATWLYANRGGKPGLRVTLRGPRSNPDAIGAQLRLQYDGGRFGPCRVVQAGSGYWSQDASTQVLGIERTPRAVWIRWPSGREQTAQLSPGDRELRVEFQP